jgi:hypothetical protein
MDTKHGKGAERRRQESPEVGSSLVCVDVDEKGKQKGRVSWQWRCMLLLTRHLPFCRVNLVTLGAEFKAHPARVIKRLLLNCLAIVWCVLVLLSLLSLLGWHVNPSAYVGGSLVEGSSSYSISRILPGASALGGGSSSAASFRKGGDDGDEDENDDGESGSSGGSSEGREGDEEGGDDEEEAIPEQMLSTNIHKKVRHIEG